MRGDEDDEEKLFFVQVQPEDKRGHPALVQFALDNRPSFINFLTVIKLKGKGENPYLYSVDTLRKFSDHQRRLQAGYK